MALATWRQLRDNIHTLLNEISDLQEKHKRPTFEFNGYPAAFIVPSGNEADYLTQQDNTRVYAFKVWLFQEYDVNTNPYDTLMDIADQVLDKIDEQESPDSARELATGINSTPGYTLVAVLATPGRFALDEQEKLLGVEITIRCMVTVDLTLLT